MSVYTAYCKMKAFKTTLMEQILHDPCKDVCDSNLLPLDSAVQVFWGMNFRVILNSAPNTPYSLNGVCSKQRKTCTHISK